MSRLKIAKQLVDDLLMFDGKVIRIRTKYRKCILDSVDAVLFSKKHDTVFIEYPAFISITSPSVDSIYFKITSDAKLPYPYEESPLNSRLEYFKNFKETAKISVEYKNSSYRYSLGPQIVYSELVKLQRILYKCVYQDDISNLMQTEKDPLSKLPSDIVQQIGTFLTGETGPLAVQKSKMNVKKGFSGVKAGKRKTQRRKLKKRI